MDKQCITEIVYYIFYSNNIINSITLVLTKININECFKKIILFFYLVNENSYGRLSFQYAYFNWCEYKIMNCFFILYNSIQKIFMTIKSFKLNGTFGDCGYYII